MEHTATIHRTESGRLFARCSCGWKSDMRATVHAAETSAYYHRVEVATPDRPTVPRHLIATLNAI